MPKEGIFIRVLKGGAIKKGDEIQIMLRKPEEAYL
jgi:MOSC domain-containing protein YiiM